MHRSNGDIEKVASGEQSKQARHGHENTQEQKQTEAHRRGFVPLPTPASAGATAHMQPCYSIEGAHMSPGMACFEYSGSQRLYGK